MHLNHSNRLDLFDECRNQQIVRVNNEKSHTVDPRIQYKPHICTHLFLITHTHTHPQPATCTYSHSLDLDAIRAKSITLVFVLVCLFQYFLSELRVLELRVLSQHLNLFETRLLKTKYNPHRRITRTQTKANGRRIESKHIVDRLRTMTTNRDIQQMKLPERKTRKPTHRNIPKKTNILNHTLIISYLRRKPNARNTPRKRTQEKQHSILILDLYPKQSFQVFH